MKLLNFSHFSWPLPILIYIVDSLIIELLKIGIINYHNTLNIKINLELFLCKISVIMLS